MKRFVILLLTAVLALTMPLSALAAGQIEVTEDISVSDDYDWTRFKGQNVTLNVYNWGEYISEGQEGAMNTVKEFERLTGAKVNYTNFESNENMYSKLSGGGVSYDVIIPSDYMVAKLISEDMLEPIDFSNVQIEPLFQDQVDFDTFSKSDFRAVKVKECEAVKKSKKLLKFVLDDGTGTDRVILSGIHEYYEPEELVGKTCIAITNLPPRAMMGIDSCGMLISAVHHENGEERLHLLMVDPHIPAGAKLY